MISLCGVLEYSEANNCCYISKWELWDIATETLYNSGDTIDTLYETLSKITAKVYIHDLNLYGIYILDYLLVKRGFKHVARAYKENCVDSILSSAGIMYKLRATYKSYKKSCFYTEFINFDRLFPSSPDDLVSLFNTSYPIAICRAIKFLNTNHSKGITIGSAALNNYKSLVGRDFWFSHFPSIPKETDAQMRDAYYGGLLGCSKKYQNKILDNVQFFDINSLYADRLDKCLMPYGVPQYFSGAPLLESPYKLYIATLSCRLELKHGYIPCIIQRDAVGTVTYVESTDEEITLTLCNVDLDSMFAAYNVTNITWHGGYMFKADYGMFSAYVDIWQTAKEQSDHDAIMRTYSKLMLVGLIGKFATKWEIESRTPYVYKNRIAFNTTVSYKKRGVYLPVAIFVNAYSRQQLLGAAVAIKAQDALVYWDTDCVAVAMDNLKCDITDIIPIHDTQLGLWKAQYRFKRLLIRGPKVYCGETEKCLKIVYSGFNNKSREQVKKIEDFIQLTSKTYETDNTLLKLVKQDRKTFYSVNKKILPGGAVYIDTPF